MNNKFFIKLYSCLYFLYSFFPQTMLGGLPQPYDSIIVLPFDAHGWFCNASQLQECFSKNKIQTIIEVGSWLGTSARFLAEQAGETGKVYCIDNWKGPINPAPFEILAYKQHKKRLDTSYQQFLSNVIHSNLTHQIIPIRMDSFEAAKALNVFADLIYIDVAHSEEAVCADILAWIEVVGKNWTEKKAK